MRYKATALNLNAEKRRELIGPFWKKAQEELGFVRVTNGNVKYDNSIVTDDSWMFFWVEADGGRLCIQTRPIGDVSTAFQGVPSRGVCIFHF